MSISGYIFISSHPVCHWIFSPCPCLTMRVFLETIELGHRWSSNSKVITIEKNVYHIHDVDRTPELLYKLSLRITCWLAIVRLLRNTLHFNLSSIHVILTFLYSILLVYYSHCLILFVTFYDMLERLIKSRLSFENELNYLIITVSL